jgi:demethylmenaquinone methyltransferase/2-methoxy-6-polyprenyl-1,4-benzoquinol methylase
MTGDTRAYYSARAPEYDRVYTQPERQSDLRAMERWLPAQVSARRILELACGTGYWTQFVAPVARSIVAIDAAPEPLEIARTRVPECGHTTFLLGDAYRILSDIGVFDAAFAGFWFSHVPHSRRREFLLHLNERLESGSPVVLFDNLFVEGSSTPIADTDDEGNTYQLRTLDNGTVHRVLKNFPTEPELLALVTAVGGDGRFTRWQYYWGLTYLTPCR